MITAETAELVESPCSLIVGTVDATGLPDASRAWGVEVIDDGHVRLLLSTQAEVTRRNVERGGRVAVTATHFFTFDQVLEAYETFGAAADTKALKVVIRR